MMFLVFDGHTNVRNEGFAVHNHMRGGMAAQPGYGYSDSSSLTYATSPGSVTFPPATKPDGSSPWPSSSELGHPMPIGRSDGGTQGYQNLEADPAHQVPSGNPAALKAAIPKRKGRMYYAQRTQTAASEQQPCSTSKIASSSGLPTSEKRFACTECVKSFEHASDWKRHEAGVHGYNDREWICVLTEAFKLRTECVFCLQRIDSLDHFQKHAIVPCSSKCTIERTFPRKDLLKQHVLLAHLAEVSTTVKKRFEVPKEWSRELEVAPAGPCSLWCGFCRCTLETTAKRMDHVAQHFRKSQDMSTWVRM